MLDSRFSVSNDSGIGRFQQLKGACRKLMIFSEEFSTGEIGKFHSGVDMLIPKIRLLVFNSEQEDEIGQTAGTRGVFGLILSVSSFIPIGIRRGVNASAGRCPCPG
jgi:hypothetical protein